MMISDVGGVQGPQPVQPNQPARISKAYSPSKPERTDAAEISMEARLLDKLRKLPEVRQDKIDAIRAQIADGTYETDERLESAVSKLLDELQE